ncbi:MAG: hypothetical protein GYA55_07380 [SAR324 cluster bacterium]|uniref:Uncharacterized protein n=1 Tax=SAR324 cluster bacterium TaxID=2024889 RepID=A0A7X9FRI0_9DELT|nr:hypothetical protein [SAR324 cluster bacterium]
MFRFLFTMLFYVIIGRWIYAEINLTFPQLAVGIDELLVSLEIPTHDTWSKEAVDGAIEKTNEMFKKAGFDASESLQRYKEEYEPKLRSIKKSLKGKEA